jgi:NDP-sugar pyrophosphorylase family protein
MSQPPELTLVVLAAGMGSRFRGPKQVTSLGDRGETIADFSLYDAWRSGFRRAVFIIREDLRAIAEEHFQRRWQGRLAIDFAVQAPDRYVAAPGVATAAIAERRTRPWGTGHALLCAREAVTGPAAVINADDFYGREALETLAGYFATAPTGQHALVGYALDRVLSPHGPVSRGCCEVDAQGRLTALVERSKIERRGPHIVALEEGAERPLPDGQLVSMNCWGFFPSIFDEAARQFADFVRDPRHHVDAEFHLPMLVNDMIRDRRGTVQVLPGGSEWCGVTYPDDKPAVVARLRAWREAGLYPVDLL